MNNKNLWILYICSFSVIALIINIINDRFLMVDFEVYYKTAERIIKGNQIYGIKEDGHYLFHYAPNAGVYFIPFTLLKLNIAKTVYWSILTTLLCLGLNYFYKLLTHKLNLVDTQKNIVIILTTLATLKHIHMELHLGQVNLLLLIIYLFLVYLLYHKKAVLFGLLLSFSIFIKPFGLIFLPYLFIKRKYKDILFFFGFVILLGFLPLLFYSSLGSFINLYSSWIYELTTELSVKQNLLADYNHTIFSVLARFTPIKYILLTSSHKIIYQLILLLLISLAILKYIKKNTNTKEGIISEMIILISLIPLLAFTNDNAFIFELPLIMFLILHYSKFNTQARFLLILGCLLIGVNIYDLLGKDIMLYLSSISIYTFGTLILLCILFLHNYKNINNEF